MMRAAALLACCALLFLAACRSSDRPPRDVVTTDPTDVRTPDLDEEEGPPPDQIISDIGTIHYVDLEGGFYGIVTDSARYNPLNLSGAFKEDGMEVRFRAVVRDDAVTIQMWGTPVELLEIKRLEVGEY